MSSPCRDLLISPPTGWVSASGAKTSLVLESPACHRLLLVLLTARGRHSTKNKKVTTRSTCHARQARSVLGEGVNRQASARASLLAFGAVASGAQSSLSDRVSYCSDSRDCHTRCSVTWAPAGGGCCCCCCCWLCMAGEAMEVGGVLLSMRMVSGLYGNCMDPVDEGRSSQLHCG